MTLDFIVKQVIDFGFWLVVVVVGIIVAIFYRRLEQIAVRIVMRTLNRFSPIKLYGTWETTIDRGHGHAPHENVRLYQFLTRVWGASSTKEETNEYRLRGWITGDRLCLIYEDKNSESSERGAMLLTIAATGNEMGGYEIGVDPSDNTVYAHPYKWKRIQVP